jgi:DNA-binding transcriptional MerR regulator
LYTVGKLAKKFGLSRSTLLYYDSIGLLAPSARTESDYRLYSEPDAKRLEQICTYRETGLSLKEIGQVLDSPETQLAQTLEKRLEELSREIDRLRGQQNFILGILKSDRPGKIKGGLTKEDWVGLLSASGYSEKDMLLWHVEFEKTDPERHRAFLELLGIPTQEIAMIRSWAGEQGSFDKND